MTTQTVTREQLHGYIDAMPDYGIPIVGPLLAHFADDTIIIETDLTTEEKADIAEGRKERKEHPENFISLDEYVKSRGVKL
jgi:DNA-binding LacI/PurR family transcriptional regulator